MKADFWQCDLLAGEIGAQSHHLRQQIWIAGGTLGTIYLTGNILLAPKLGAGALVGLVVTGQLLFAVLCDHFGGWASRSTR